MLSRIIFVMIIFHLSNFTNATTKSVSETTFYYVCNSKKFIEPRELAKCEKSVVVLKTGKEIEFKNNINASNADIVLNDIHEIFNDFVMIRKSGIEETRGSSIIDLKPPYREYSVYDYVEPVFSDNKKQFFMFHPNGISEEGDYSYPFSKIFSITQDGLVEELTLFYKKENACPDKSFCLFHDNKNGFLIPGNWINEHKIALKICKKYEEEKFESLKCPSTFLVKKNGKWIFEKN